MLYPTELRGPVTCIASSGRGVTGKMVEVFLVPHPKGTRGLCTNCSSTYLLSGYGIANNAVQ